jgi:hypothetical protein
MTKRPQPPCPECEKLNAVAEESNKIGEFLDWMQTEGLIIGSYDNDGNFYPLYKPINNLLADYFDIDLNKVEQERRALLDWIREEQE